MSISFILWFLISAFLLLFWLWTLYVLYNQKRAWKFYADKKKLRYSSNGFYEGSNISGVVDGYKISIFTSEHSELDARSGRRLSAIEINLHSILSVKGAMASGGMVALVEALNMSHEFKPAVKGWDDSYVAKADNIDYMREYLNEDRLGAVLKLMAMDSVWVVLLFSDDASLLRIDTPLPLDNPKKIDDIVKKMIKVARVLELKEGEDKDLLRKSAKPDEKQKVLDIDDDLLDDDIGLELED